MLFHNVTRTVKRGKSKETEKRIIIRGEEKKRQTMKEGDIHAYIYTYT
jgi:hypothetical protein